MIEQAIGWILVLGSVNAFALCIIFSIMEYEFISVRDICRAVCLSVFSWITSLVVLIILLSDYEVFDIIIWSKK